MARKKSKAKRAIARKSAAAKARVKSKVRKPRAKKTAPGRTRRAVRGTSERTELVAYKARGIGARSAGQAGDTQGISANPTADSESVEELLEEGQSFEAEILNGVERAADPDESEVVTREVEEGDVAEEYRDHRENEN
jgi:hypothetical protein